MTERPAELMRRLAANTRVGYSFDQEFYTADAVFKADMDQVISRKWLVAGHVSRIPNRGDYFLYKIGSEQIIVIRENHTSIRAFFNVCRHRGSTLCSEESGNKKLLVCPYHAWTYDREGKLIGVSLQTIYHWEKGQSRPRASQPVRRGSTMCSRPAATPASRARATSSGSSRPGMAKRLPAVSAVRR